MTVPMRRWFRWSSRTLLVAMAAVGCWLGWELYEIRKRAEARAWIDEHHGVWESFDAPGHMSPEAALWMPGAAVKYEKFTWAQRFLGDTPVFLIAFRRGAISEGELDRLGEQFPEAIVSFVDFNPAKKR
ncbi:MAG: hypothetical protein AB7O59_03895 [Pirellulales bacterium]